MPPMWCQYVFLDDKVMADYSAIICRRTNSHPDLLSQLKTDGITHGPSSSCAVLTKPAQGNKKPIRFHLKQVIFDDVSSWIDLL